MQDEIKKEDGMGKSVFAVGLLMALCCGLPILLAAVGLGAIGLAIKSNLLLIVAGLIVVVGAGYLIWRRRCSSCNIKPKAK